MPSLSVFCFLGAYVGGDFTGGLIADALGAKWNPQLAFSLLQLEKPALSLCFCNRLGAHILTTLLTPPHAILVFGLFGGPGVGGLACTGQQREDRQ